MRRYALPLILLLALALRLVNLGGRSLWYDEAFAVLFAEKGLNAMLYGTLTPVAGGAADIHPLLYYVTLDGWMAVFGQSPFVVRLWSVIPGVAAVGVMYLLGRDLFSRRTGLAAALVTAVAPFHVQYSQEARMYSLLALLLMTATWCFVRGWKDFAPPSPPLPPHGGKGENSDVKPLSLKWGRRSGQSRSLRTAKTAQWGGGSQWGWWVAFGALAGLVMYAQQLAAFYLAPLGLVGALSRQGRIVRGTALGAGAALVIYAPWLVNLPGQLEKVGSYYWIPTPNAARFLLTLRTFMSVGIDLPMPAALYALAGALFVLIFLGMQVARTLRQGRRTDRPALLFVLWMSAAPVALMWLVSQARPVYLERALLPSALMLYLALGWLFARGGLLRPVAGVVVVVGLALAALGLNAQYMWNRFPNSPFDEAAALIREEWRAGDVVIHLSKLSALPTIYYARELTQRYVTDAPGSPEDTLALPTQQALGLLADACIQSAARDAGRVWLVTFADAARQAEAAGRDDVRRALDWLDANFALVQQRRFNDLDVSLYVARAGAARETDCPAETA